MKVLLGKEFGNELDGVPGLLQVAKAQVSKGFTQSKKVIMQNCETINVAVRRSLKNRPFVQEQGFKVYMSGR